MSSTDTSSVRWQSWVIPLLRILIFPWLFWAASGEFARRIDRRWPFGTSLRRTVRGTLYIVLFLPMTIVCLVEVLIAVNEMVLGEQPSYRLQSDFRTGWAEAPFPQIGPPTPSIAPVDRSTVPREIFHSHLVEKYSPVLFQKVSHHPEWDIPVFLDFDGNMNPRDNLANEPKFRPHVAGVYGEVTAETPDAYYLTYSLYRIKDYDHPIREFMTNWSFHDNDNEGFHLRVGKKSMRITDVETWFHNCFLLYNLTGESTGTEPVHGTIHVEDGTHPLVYGQAQGHGVRLVQNTDRDDVKENVKVLRFVGSRRDVPFRADHSLQTDGTYRLRNFDRWYEQARGPFHQDGDPRATSLFSVALPLGKTPSGKPIEIGRFFAGLDYAIGSWSRPKPMWSWDDGWDDLPNCVWHFFPSIAFDSHGGVKVSHNYLYNRPIEKLFGTTPNKISPMLRFEQAERTDSKWGGLKGRGDELDRNLYLYAALRWFKRYVNYVFRSLG